MRICQKTSKRLLITVLSAILCFTKTLADSDQTEQNRQDDKVEEKQLSDVNPGKRSRVEPLEEFIPSEEVSADKSVALPSDI